MGEADKPGRLRSDPRYAVQWKATIRCPDWAAAERIAAANISRGGMFLHTQRPFEVGARVKVTLELPDAEHVALLATVRHNRADGQGRPGIGVEVDVTCRGELLALADIARLRQGKPPAPPPAPVDDLPAGPAQVQIPAGAQSPIVGIDFGVSYTSVALAIGSTVYTVPDRFGRTQCPSQVFYEESGEVAVGWDARRRQLERPDRCVSSVKRLLGRPFSDHAVAGFLQSAPYASAEGPGDSILLQLTEQPLAVPQVCAELFRHVRQVAEAQLQCGFSKVVLTHPVTFDGVQCAALKRVAELAGLQVVAMISEPLAGALAYGCGQGQPEIVAVYDFGGGTFDFTVLELSVEQFKVLGSAGDGWLGGDDFDFLLASALADVFWRQSEVELQKRAVEWQRVLMASERAKRALSKEETTLVEVLQIVESPQSLDLRQAINREGLQRVCQPLLERSLDVCREALTTAGITPTALGQVVLTGGTTRIPFVREGLEQFFGRRLGDVVHAEDAVALGAGLYAARMAGHPARTASSLAGLG